MEICDYLNRDVTIEDNLCFVIMPFNEELNSFFNHGIRPIVEEQAFICRRADQHMGSTSIMFEIFDDILKAKVIIADLTGGNPNVFYEVGICHALKKNVILLKRAGTHVPFDLQGVRHIEYEDGPAGENKLRELLTAALTFEKDKEEGELFDVRAMARTLKKACHLWDSGHEILIKFEEFLEIVLGLEYLSPTDEEISFLCLAAAYYGKFMKRMAETARANRAAIHSLAVEVASGTFTRVPWRAAAMLEHFNRDMVEEEIDGFNDKIRNPQIFPQAILQRSTVSTLIKTIDDPQTHPNTREKLAEALRQIQAEFDRVEKR